MKFWIKVSFIIIVNFTKIFFEIPPCAKNVIFVTEFVLLDQNPHFYVKPDGSENGIAKILLYKEGGCIL